MAELPFFFFFSFRFWHFERIVRARTSDNDGDGRPSENRTRAYRTISSIRFRELAVSDVLRVYFVRSALTVRTRVCRPDSRIRNRGTGNIHERVLETPTPTSGWTRLATDRG